MKGRLVIFLIASWSALGIIMAPVARGQTTNIPNDPLFPLQWNLQNTGQNGGTPGADIHAVSAWSISRCSSQVTIAILDTGVDPNQPDLQGKVVPGATFVDGTTTANDDNGHGTEIAGAAAAWTNNATGIAGVCPEGRIMPVKVASAGGHTDDAEGDVRVAAGIRWAVDHGAQVINMSLGVLDTPAMRDAAAYAYSHNVVFVAASGNSGNDASPYPAPALYPHVLAVGGTDNQDRRWGPSTYGTKDLVMAPAVDVWTTGRGNKYEKGCCTSIAAPQVAGLAALILSLRPGLSVDAVISAIERGSDPIEGQSGFSPKVGWGRINAYRSLQIAQTMVSATSAVTSTGGQGHSGSFTVHFGSVQAGKGQVYFGSGPGCMGLVGVATGDQLSSSTEHVVAVTGNDLPGTVGNIGILPGQTYWYETVTVTPTGTVLDNNGGRCYQVTVPAADKT